MITHIHGLYCWNLQVCARHKASYGGEKIYALRKLGFKAARLFIKLTPAPDSCAMDDTTLFHK